MTTTRRRIRLSQNFLRSPQLAHRLVEASSIGSGDIVIEIGPGGGALTRALASRCHQVVAIEQDPQLALRLSRRLASTDPVLIYQADFLCLPLPSTPYKVFANIPFSRSAEIITKLTRDPNPPEEAFLFLQRETAERCLGMPRESLFSMMLHPWFEMEILHHFRRDDFVPEPSVSVVLLRFSKRGPPEIAPSDAQLYRDFMVAAFSEWRRTIRFLTDAGTTGETLGKVLGKEGIRPWHKPSELS
ncbi:MAG TPA: rRNA adenine dimethyltransferase family protein, partial [Thermomicrobiaceae bacterium]|nr:rRNA adenine dimethyltransferase family protein [Thermomicrobiaceae bacterium]